MGRALAIIVTGPVGAGKSTTAWELRELLGPHGVANVLIDMDYLRMVHPEPPGDPFASGFGRRNLAAMWPNVRAQGINVAIIPDVVESMEHRQRYEAAMPDIDVLIVRLNVPMEAIISRLDARESPEHVAWYHHRAPQLQGIMERGGVGDVVVDTLSEDSPRQVAMRVLQAIVAQQPTIAQYAELARVATELGLES